MQRALVMPRRTALAFAALLALVLAAGVADPGLALAFAPALVLLALFTLGVRPGEALIERLITRAAAPTRARAASSPRPPLPLFVRPVGRSFATALAMRPPPLALAHEH
ncbi:hypothetical protein DVA67_025670 [Solirubrobacter sp. CPCC 204708]|uniref:DUF58 domain-containing protein n=1 Tax=Solirubrobacter deserti TaxID=2282478 RepID=A0ABT4RQP2_9ACTN|nr:hypothetical protein [Solirubrobacter deserti]MBE2319390.1 hypothetical protein [Solirubrobacter deserti]MDA0140887.1 hypothetical protein [Solirubrobacter deserti]